MGGIVGINDVSLNGQNNNSYVNYNQQQYHQQQQRPVSF